MIDGTAPVDVMALPLDRFLNYIVEWHRLRMAETKFQAWLFELETPPLGAPVDDVAEMIRFRETMGRIG